MLGSEFLSANARSSPQAWEAVIVALATRGALYAWPWAEVTLASPVLPGRELVVRVATDYLAVGEGEDLVRLPLTPLAAQRCADAGQCLLPTYAMVQAIHLAAPCKLDPQPMRPNLGASLQQYADHSAAVDTQLASRGWVNPSRVRSGHKKDVVVGRILKPGKVVIYGWCAPAGVPPRPDPAPTTTLPWRIQPYSNVHGDGYVDYSHGIRLVDRRCTLDGTDEDLARVLGDADLARLASDEGALSVVRYPVGPASLVPLAPVPRVPGSLADLGLNRLREEAAEARWRKAS